MREIRSITFGDKNNLIAKLKSSKVDAIIAIVVVACIVAMGVGIKNFFVLSNLLNIIAQASPVGILALGLTFVLITGGMDLSLPYVMSAAAVIGADVMKKTGNTFVGCLVMLLVALAFGTFNGLAVSKAKMIPFIVTLATGVIASGLALFYTNSQSIYGLPNAYIKTLSAHVGGVMIPPIILFILCCVCANFVLSKTVFGRWIYQLGTNENTARVSGVPIDKAKFSLYILSSLFAGIAAILLTAQVGSASAGMGGDTMMLNVISAAVIGGVSINGGRGTIFGAALGSVFIMLLSNGMNLMGISYYAQMVVQGCVIVALVFADAQRRR